MAYTKKVKATETREKESLKEITGYHKQLTKKKTAKNLIDLWGNLALTCLLCVAVEGASSLVPLVLMGFSDTS